MTVKVGEKGSTEERGIRPVAAACGDTEEAGGPGAEGFTAAAAEGALMLTFAEAVSELVRAGAVREGSCCCC